MALDIPLQGLKLDVDETYFMISNEALLTSTVPQKPEIGYRLSPLIRIQLSKNLSLEFGIKLRLEDLNIKTDESLFFNASVEIKI